MGRCGAFWRLTSTAMNKHEKHKAKSESLQRRVSNLGLKVSKINARKRRKCTRTYFPWLRETMDMVRGAIEPAVPGTSDDAHPALKVSFGKMQCQLPSEQERQAFKCAVANTLDYYNCYRTVCGALCAQCRRVLSLDTQRVFATCRACVRVLYCTTACARAHNEEHRPVNLHQARELGRRRASGHRGQRASHGRGPIRGGGAAGG